MKKEDKLFCFKSPAFDMPIRRLVKDILKPPPPPFLRTQHELTICLLRALAGVVIPNTEANNGRHLYVVSFLLDPVYEVGIQVKLSSPKPLCVVDLQYFEDVAAAVYKEIPRRVSRSRLIDDYFQDKGIINKSDLIGVEMSWNLKVNGIDLYAAYHPVLCETDNRAALNAFDVLWDQYNAFFTYLDYC